MFSRNKGIKTFITRFLGFIIMAFSIAVIISWVFSRESIMNILIRVVMFVLVFIFGIGIFSIYPDILLDKVGIQYRACNGFVDGVVKWEEVGGIVAVGKKKNQWAVLINRKKFRIYWPGNLYFNMLYAMNYRFVQPIILISNELERYSEVVQKIQEKSLDNSI
jgi:hypothetical protein